MVKQLLAVLGLTTAYAVIRYAGFGGVSLIHVPGYLLNKSISMAAAVALAVAAQELVRNRRDAYLFWSKAAAHLAFGHVLLSLALMSTGSFPGFFDGDRMSLTGEGMLILGVLASYCFWRVGTTRQRWSSRRPLTLLGCALVAGHLFVMGSGGWLHFERWHGGLPPITLLSFCMAVFSLISFLRVKEKDLSPEAAGEGSAPYPYGENLPS